MDAEEELQRRRSAARLLTVQLDTVVRLMTGYSDSAQTEVEGDFGDVDEMPEEDRLLRLNMDASDLSVLRQLYTKLRENSIQFAEQIVSDHQAKLQPAEGPSEQQISIMEKNLFYLNNMMQLVKKHSDYTSLHKLQLPDMTTTQAAAEYLSRRMFFVCKLSARILYMKGACLLASCGENTDFQGENDGLLRGLSRCHEECKVQVESLSAAYEEHNAKLQELKNAAGLGTNKIRMDVQQKEEKFDVDPIEAATEVQQQLKQDLDKAEGRLALLTDAVAWFSCTTGLLQKANLINDRLKGENPRLVTFGDRSISCYALHKPLFNAESTGELGALLAEELCNEHEQAVGVMAVDCVSAITEFVVKLCKNQEFAHREETDPEVIKAAICKEVRSYAA